MRLPGPLVHSKTGCAHVRRRNEVLEFNFLLFSCIRGKPIDEVDETA
jgi:hypothetical protein